MKEKNNNEKLKDKVNNVKDFLSDKKNKALIKLIIYFIFFLILIIYVRVSSSNHKNYINELENNLPQTITNGTKVLQNMNDYNMMVYYEIIDSIVTNGVINIKLENNIKSIIYNDNEYFMDNNGWYYLLNDVKEYVNFEIFNIVSLIEPKNIYNYLLKSTYQYKKEDINNNIYINSLLKVSDFGLINNNIIESNDNIIIETIENNNSIVEIDFDLTNYYILNNSNTYSYKLKIVFNN